MAVNCRKEMDTLQTIKHKGMYSESSRRIMHRYLIKCCFGSVLLIVEEAVDSNRVKTTQSSIAYEYQCPSLNDKLV